ncbi:MAG: penicillin-binding protein 2 [Rhodospirillaceae bacterium]|nr:penicillin-binding protein 2 [Rhodospirillaceae bacterium]
MRGETGRANLFTRRAIIVGGAQALLTAGLAGRLYQLQVVESERYQVLADENRINMQLLPPARGRIFDRFGQVLAENRLNYRLVVVPEAALNLDRALDEIAALVPIEDHDRERVLREARRKQRFVPITIRENLTWDEVSQIEVNAPDLPGVMIDVGSRRLYAFGRDTVHIVGYVGAVNESDLEQTDDPLLTLPDFRIGKNGAEKVLESSLRGEAGSRQVEVNAYGRVIRELSRRTGRPGDDHMLTIDLGLQQYVAARFGEESGSAVVLDVHSGEILALASMPSYDPNLFTSGISQRQWRELIGHPRFPLSNKSIAGQYSPGSTFKMIVALAALESGEVSPYQRFYCDGSIKLGKRRFRCWRRYGHGHVAMVQGLMESCDVYFYEVAKRVGIDRIAAMSERFGFGRKLDIELPGEKSGLVPTREWKLARIGEPWQGGETLIVGIGQGYLLTTPLQLAVMVARIANGGIAVEPRLLAEVIRDGQPVPRESETFDPMGLSPAHLDIVRKGMNFVVNEPKGTAYLARIEEPALAMAGKTGSVQVRRISEREHRAGVIKNEDRPWKERDHALFVAYAPLERPRYGVAVVVEHGGSGGTVAAPIARDILREVQRRDPSARVRNFEPVTRPHETA